MLSTPSTKEQHCTTSVHFVLHWQLTILWNTYGGTSDLYVDDEAGFRWRNNPLILLPWACMRLAQCHCCTQQESSKSGFQVSPSHLASLSACGQAFIIVQTLSCSTGGYPSIRHNELRDIIANLLKEVCTDVTMEPSSQLLPGEVLDMRTSISWEEARLDISARGFWGSRFEQAFFDVRVFNPSAPTNWSQQITSVYRKHKHMLYWLATLYFCISRQTH